MADLRRIQTGFRSKTVFACLFTICIAYKILTTLTSKDTLNSQINHLSSLKTVVKNVVALESGNIEIQLEVDIHGFIDTIDLTNGQASQAIAEEFPPPVSYNINSPNVCTDSSKLDLIIYLHSAPKNSGRRALVRSTWGNPNLFKDGLTKVVFLIGLVRFDDTERESIQKKLELEQNQHHDLIQGNFQDDYRNLTLKGVMGLHWVSNYCPNAKFALKSDDDVFVDIFHLMDILNKVNEADNTIACVTYNDKSMPILRYPKNCMKWCIKYRELAGRRFYPKYCAGLAFVLSRDLIPEMYEKSKVTPFFWVDDAYITGLLTVDIKDIHNVMLNRHMSLVGSDAFKQYTSDSENLTFIFIHGNDDKARIDNHNLGTCSYLSTRSVINDLFYDHGLDHHMWEALLSKLSEKQMNLLMPTYNNRSLTLRDNRLKRIAKKT